MTRVGRIILRWLLVAALCAGSNAAKPTITPNKDEILIFEGEPLEIVCTSSRPIVFDYPEDVLDAITTSNVSIEEELESPDIHKSILKRPNTIFGDTGWYGCANEDVEIDPDIHDDSNVSWVYVYVRSNSSFFVQADTYVSLRGVVGDFAVIPCRPTWPNAEVIFQKGDNDVELGDKLSYDSKLGFTLRNLTLKDSEFFKCVINHENDEQEVNYHLLVMRKPQLVEPKIIEEPLRHVTRGQTLNVNCTIDVESDLHYVLKWNTPHESNRILTQLYAQQFGGNTKRATSELTIRDVQDDDEGLYECVIATYYDKKKTSTYIKVYDPQIKYINLTSQDSDKHYQRRFGDRVQWVVYVDAYPPPMLKWFNPKGEELIGQWSDAERAKFAVKISPTQTILRINRLDVSDMGIYSLQAANNDKLESLNFTLDVMAKPIPIFRNIEAYYSPDKEVEIECLIAAFPAPNVTWTFLQCPNYPSHENSTLITLTNTTEFVSTTSFRSVLSIAFNMSGLINCTACNALGCDYASDKILVSDGNGGFGIIEPNEKITEGDHLQVICAASIYNYTDNIQWMDAHENVLLETDRLKIIREKTRFTHRAILDISSVDKSDAGDYICMGKIKDGTMDQMSYYMQVYDSAKPTLNTNMNGTELVIDIGKDGHRTVTLTCFSSGMPVPKIEWYKDDTLIVSNDQYQLLYRNQELDIKYLLEKDNGKYLCRAENRLGKVEAYQMISIKGKEISKGLITFLVILIFAFIALIIYVTIKVRREKKMRKELMEAGLMHFEEGALECLNPDLTVDDQAELLPYDKKWEFPRDRLKLGKQLGSGNFGVVMKAEARGIIDEETVTTVAVKMVRRTTDPTYVRALASELKIMVHLGKHLNVVNLLGACTKNITKRELLVIVEYCRYGNLHNYLLRHRKDFINQIDSTTGKFDPMIGIDILTRTASMSSSNRIQYAALTFSRSLSVNSDIVPQTSGTDSLDTASVNMSPEGCIVSNNSIQPGWRSNYHGDYKDQNLKPICTQDLLSWAFQVARGMEYLSQRKVLHGDLAARNILLAESNVVKICDFGLAKTMYKDDNYKKKGDGPMPLKWMAIESLRDKIFSTQSDIWSFGIVLWEFFTLAETPYPGMDAETHYQKLIEGYRMEQPEYATKDVYDIMLQCWKAKPTLRPSFTQLVASIGGLLEESVRSHYVSLNDPYMDMNTMIFENGKSDYLTMMSAPDHTVLSSPSHEYVNSPACASSPTDSTYLCMSPGSRIDESGIFSPRPDENTRFNFPSPTSDSEQEAVELMPMLNKVQEDPYLQPINVHERRAEFARQRDREKSMISQINHQNDRDSGYCNAPKNLHLIDINGERESGETKDDSKNHTAYKNFTPTIINTQDNYVNMPKQKSDFMKNIPDGFSNPSYVYMSNTEPDKHKV